MASSTATIRTGTFMSEYIYFFQFMSGEILCYKPDKQNTGNTSCIMERKPFSLRRSDYVSSNQSSQTYLYIIPFGADCMIRKKDVQSGEGKMYYREKFSIFYTYGHCICCLLSFHFLTLQCIWCWKIYWDMVNEHLIKSGLY